MRADVNVKQIVVTTIIVVLTVAGMYAVLIVAWSFVNGQYFRKNMIEGEMVGIEVLSAKDPPTPKVRRPSAPVLMVSQDEEIESNPPKKVVPRTETPHDDTMGDMVGAKVLFA